MRNLLLLPTAMLIKAVMLESYLPFQIRATLNLGKENDINHISNFFFKIVLDLRILLFLKAYIVLCFLERLRIKVFSYFVFTFFSYFHHNKDIFIDLIQAFNSMETSLYMLERTPEVPDICDISSRYLWLLWINFPKTFHRFEIIWTKRTICDSITTVFFSIFIH